jgi:nucleolar protein 16
MMTSFITALQRISNPVNHRSNTLSVGFSGAGHRHSSMREISYLKKLISVYGVDSERMAKDRKLNPEQRTAGELRRALRNARLDGGVELRP